MGYIRGHVAGVAWLYEPANKAEALQIFQKSVRGMTPELAAKTYDVLLAPVGGFHRSAALDVDGIRTVLKVRASMAAPRRR